MRDVRDCSSARSGLVDRARDPELPNCGCFGDAMHFRPEAVLYDSVMGATALAAPAYFYGAGLASLDSWSQRGL